MDNNNICYAPSPMKISSDYPHPNETYDCEGNKLERLRKTDLSSSFTNLINTAQESHHRHQRQDQ